MATCHSCFIILVYLGSVMRTNKDELNLVLVTDCGSTTTKALLFEKTAQGWRQTCRGEAPTTVEQPVADVTVGALNAFREIEELSGRSILRQQQLLDQSPFIEAGTGLEQGIDLFLSTSSAGGGLQMMVAGVARQMTTESAQRAALGAGAIVMDAISAEDGRADHERVKMIRQLRPDIILLTGGTDGGAKNHVIEMAEVLLAAAPRPRFGETLRLPVIYAGNQDAVSEVQEILGNLAQIAVVPNVRPTLEHENLTPAREAIHEFFLTHVMSHSPGYDRLLKWSPFPIKPTPAAVGDVVVSYARESKQQLLCVDIGGATTDVFSVFRNPLGEQIFNRTVSANLGMSYSIANVLRESGLENIARWLSFEISPSEIRNRLLNKMIRPTSIPQTLEDLWLEQGICREALRLSLEHHKSLAVGLSGVQQRRGIAEIFAQQTSRYDLVNMMQLDLVIGSGGVLSHAPNRLSAALMMLEGFELQGLTLLAVDSVFMMPHLGVLAAIHPQAAQEIFLRDCLIRLAHSVVPIYPRKLPLGSSLALLQIDGANIKHEDLCIKVDDVSLVPMPPGKSVCIRIKPLHRSIDVGAGPGVMLEREVETAKYGFILDGRNRPIRWPEDGVGRVIRQREIMTKLGLLSGGAE
jgi:uncharacterized protein (TIGR01319 family)